MPSPNPNAQAPEPDYVELPTRDTTGLESPALGGPETPRMDSPGFNSNTFSSPSAQDPLYRPPFSPPAGMGAPRDSFMAPAPSFMSMGRNSRHDSYTSFDSGKGFAAGEIDKRGSYASGLTAEDQRRTSVLGASPLAAGAGLAAGASAADANDSVPNLGWRTDPQGEEALAEKPRWMGGAGAAGGKKKKWWITGIVAGVLVIGLGVGLGVGLNNKLNKSDSHVPIVEVIGGSTTTRMVPTSTSSSAAAEPTPTGPIRGGNGSLVKLTNGTEITYVNRHGGTWAYDPTNPLLNDAQPNNWTRPLNQTWDWDQIIHGVNVGGWFVTEPFIVPGLYEDFPDGPAGKSVDEYTLTRNMGDKVEEAMTRHYETFITEVDFMNMAAAGLTWVRIPIGFWALETQPGEPFLEGVAWKYIVQALGWCRKYGLRVNLDLHAAAGSQNGWNHSGHLGVANWMKGTMGLANLQRSLDTIQALLEFIMQPEWKDVVPMFGILNEPRVADVSHGNLGSFYLHMHERFRNLTGVGEGNGPILSVFEGFEGADKWYGFAQGGDGTGPDRMMLDVHQYTVFQMPQDTRPVMEIANKGCEWWYDTTRNTTNRFGLYNTGEWSLAWNDCGQWVNEVDGGTRWEGTHRDNPEGIVYGSCEEWMRPEQWNSTVIAALKNTYLAGVDALQSNFFWTWNIGSTSRYENPAPFWSYKLGLQMGWIPDDPREAEGHCERVANKVPQVTFTGYQPFMTGGVGAGEVPASASGEYPWPLTSMEPSFVATDMSRLYQYTRTGPPLSPPSLAPSYSALPSDVSSAMAPTTTYAAVPAFATVSGCSYPPIYSAHNLSLPATSACGAGQPSTEAYYKRAVITPAPRA